MRTLLHDGPLHESFYEGGRIIIYTYTHPHAQRLVQANNDEVYSKNSPELLLSKTHLSQNLFTLGSNSFLWWKASSNMLIASD